MQRKWLMAGLLGLAMLAVCAATMVIFWSSFGLLRDRQVDFDVFRYDAVSVEATEEQRFTVSEGARLDLTALAGDVQVTGAGSGEIVVTAHKTGWGQDEAEAQAVLDEVRLVMEQSGNTVTVRVERPPQVVLVGVVREAQVDFTVQVPVNAEVQVFTGFGQVSAAGLTGGAVLSSGSGKVSASGLAGEVELRSDFGDVTLERAEPDGVTAHSSSGAVRLEQVEAAGTVALTSDFGDVRFEGGAAEAVTANTRSGRVTLTDLTVAGSAEARSDFGDVTVLRVAAGGGYTLVSGSGNVSLDGATGRVTAESGFGEVSVINAEDVTVDLHSSSGTVSLSGSLGAGPHSLRSNFGNVTLRLPPETAANLELSTGFGSIRSAFPITLTGEIDDAHWQGTLNGGGPSLTVHTDSGSITLDPLNA
jgi:DUF4097 and DUF4098 domain-containing protein YvlB